MKTRQLFFAAALALAACTTSAVLVLADTTVAGFVRNSIDPARGNADDSGFVMGNDGFGRIAYIADDTPYDLRYIRCTDADCSSPVVTTVVSVAEDDDTGHHILAIGSDGFARVIYNDSTNFNLQLVRCTDADCTATTTTEIANNGSSKYYFGTGILFGSDGFPRIVYTDSTDNSVHYMRCTDADCASSPVDTDTTARNHNSEGGNSFVLGNDHFARMLYVDSDNELYFLRCTNADCSTHAATTTIDANAANQPGGYGGTDMQIGSDGFPRIYYSDNASPYAQHYVVCNDADCTAPTNTTLPDASDYGAENRWGMALRSGDLATIAYPAADHTGHVINCKNVLCTDYYDVTVDTDTVNYVMSGSSIVAIGSDDLPRVVYFADNYVDGAGAQFVRFNTLDGLDAISRSPTLTVSSPDIYSTSAVLHGSITNIGSSTPTVRGFVWGTTTAYGATTTESGSFSTGAFSATLSNLTCNSGYHYAPYATNDSGPGYGGDETLGTGGCAASAGGSTNGGGAGAGGGGIFVPYIPPNQATNSTPSSPTTSHLSDTQVQSLLSLLGSFNVDQSVIDAVNTILHGQPPTSTVPTTSYTFTRDLQFNDTGDDVKALQQYLNTHGFTITPSGPGSPGNETTTFGSLTLAALIKFQQAHNITPAVGSWAQNEGGDCRNE